MWTCPCGEHSAPVPRHREITAGVVASMREVPFDSFDVDFVVELPEGKADAVADARRKVAAVEALQREAAEESRRVARSLRRMGLTVADVARVLGVSPQRVSQLAPPG